MDFVIGSKGRLGREILKFLQAGEVIAPERADYRHWWQHDAVDKISFFLEKYRKSESKGADKEGVIYVASGLLDPAKSEEEHQAINFLLAKNIIEAANKVGYRTVTFGTIMEQVIGADTTNPYILSKIRLSNLVAELSKIDNPPLHVRIHTLYGTGLPSPFMFLGQILDALVKESRFDMTPGSQLREYHHIEDEVKAIALLVKAKISGIVELNHSQAVSLRELAYYIFDNFNRLELLNIGSSSAPVKENYTFHFMRPEVLSGLIFRETLPSIVDYLRLCKRLLGECHA